MTAWCAAATDLVSQEIASVTNNVNITNVSEDVAEDAVSDSPARDARRFDGDGGGAEEEDANCEAGSAVTEEVDDDDVVEASVGAQSEEGDDGVGNVSMELGYVEPLELTSGK